MVLMSWALLHQSACKYSILQIICGGGEIRTPVRNKSLKNIYTLSLLARSYSAYGQGQTVSETSPKVLIPILWAKTETSLCSRRPFI